MYLLFSFFIWNSIDFNISSEPYKTQSQPYTKKLHIRLKDTQAAEYPTHLKCLQVQPQKSPKRKHMSEASAFIDKIFK